MRRTLTLPLVAACGATVLGLLGLGAGSAGAATPPADTTTTVAPAAAAAPAAPTEAAPVVTSSSTITLPLLGVPLTVDLTTGPGGALATVFVNPADGFTATAVKPNKVAFVNDAGTAKVVVKTGHGTQSIEAKASTLDDFTTGGGAGAWTGDVFGTGTTTTVNYVIAAAADGSPDITGVTSSDPSAVVGQVQHENDDDEQQAKVRVTFTSGGQSRTLSIKVEVESDDGTSRAKVKISLSPLKGVALPADQVAGPQVWTGVLCDGTSARIDYVVDASGAITSATATPDAERLDVNGNQLDARWAQGGRVKIKVRGEDGQLKVSVQDRTRCDSPTPSVNTPISPDATNPSDSGHDDDGGNGGDNSGRHGGRHGDGSTSTTVAGTSDTTATPSGQTTTNQTSTSSSSGSGSSGRNGGRNGGGDSDD